MRRLAKIALAGAALLAVGAAGVGAWYKTTPTATAFAGGTPVPLARYKGADPTGAAPELKRAPLAERGAYLARAADCAPCHSTPGGPPFSGGRAFNLPFGTIYSANITPDRTAGIGAWTDAEFIRAVKHGQSRDGDRLYPAMPYPSYAAMTDDDVRAIRAYLQTVSPVSARTPANTLGFPFGWRPLMGVWNWFFAKEGEFRPNTDRSPAWNRGAYLAEALGHCGDCHTTRNIGYGLNNRRKYAGAVTGGWKAHNITSDKQAGIGAWSDAALTSYLTTGFAPGHGAANGPMGEAVDHGLRYLTPGDIQAMIAYLRTVPAIGGTTEALQTRPAAEGFAKAQTGSQGERLFAANCAGCHDWTGISPLSANARLIGLRSVSDPSAANIVQVILAGVDRKPPDGMAPMPAFGSVLSDREVAALANYVSERFGHKDAGLQPKDVSRLRKEGAH